MSKDNDENKQNSGEKKCVQITTKGKTHMEKIEQTSRISRAKQTHVHGTFCDVYG